MRLLTRSKVSSSAGRLRWVLVSYRKKLGSLSRPRYRVKSRPRPMRMQSTEMTMRQTLKKEAAPGTKNRSSEIPPKISTPAAIIRTMAIFLELIFIRI